MVGLWARPERWHAWKKRTDKLLTQGEINPIDNPELSARAERPIGVEPTIIVCRSARFPEQVGGNECLNHPGPGRDQEQDAGKGVLVRLFAENKPTSARAHVAFDTRICPSVQSWSIHRLDFSGRDTEFSTRFSFDRLLARKHANPQPNKLRPHPEEKAK